MLVWPCQGNLAWRFFWTSRNCEGSADTRYIFSGMADE